MRGTIKSADEISALFKTAQRITTGNIIVLMEKADEKRGSQGRVAFIAGKRLGTAPQRNRAKRLMRHAAFLAGAPWSGYDVIFIAREKMLSAGLDEVVRDVKTLQYKFEKKRR